ncbi:hypothetical protein C499_04396 [Halogeometricum borinquense DSM 11551]|uniref:DUF3054 domain-containing protein n=2 Tax=Halogeometricum borinquense TaxID=60847 RepID=E4NSI0_HALBP|nr:DUF3054 domain-containing protein [Halogeometricum borinquense]ADQ66969.1 Protein of unknown function (DUF3054) [Halogeometricum borinquense DSM 11551]ELY30050.1 hypothetical protein C499_04396 [Halogeometricum borinquense DSM 11551]RYJ14061.1 DUF3054 domain-containing protein [Halogeometricum borinquense]
MGTSNGSFLDQRLDADALPLAVGDFLMLAAVLTIGFINHNGVDQIFDDPTGWILTLVPFLLGWGIFGVLIGAYSAGAAETAKASIPLTIRGWIPGAILGLGLRASPLFEGGFAWIFAAVILATGMLALVAWRWLFFKIIG